MVLCSRDFGKFNVRCPVKYRQTCFKRQQFVDKKAVQLSTAGRISVCPLPCLAYDVNDGQGLLQANFELCNKSLHGQPTLMRYSIPSISIRKLLLL